MPRPRERNDDIVDDNVQRLARHLTPEQRRSLLWDLRRDWGGRKNYIRKTDRRPPTKPQTV